MYTRQQVIDFCLSLEGAYEDYPFRDENWTIMRHRENKKMFAAIYRRQGHIWVNVKCDPTLAYLRRSTFSAVVPAYHMNKEHWNSIILDGTVPEPEIKTMIVDSYALTKEKQKAREKK